MPTILKQCLGRNIVENKNKYINKMMLKTNGVLSFTKVVIVKHFGMSTFWFNGSQTTKRKS